MTTASEGPLSVTARPGKPPRATTLEADIVRRFKLKKGSEALRRAKWLNRETIYEGKLISMTGRVVRLFAPDSAEPKRHVDLSYDWVIPVR